MIPPGHGRAGSLADVLGRRRVFIAGVVLFGTSGVLSAVSGDVLLLNIVRALGGIGAAAAVTGGSSILAETFHGAARVRAFGLLGTTLGLGLAFGPTVGGLLVDTLGWRAVFGTPAAMACLVLLLSPVPPRVPGASGRRVDWPGAALFTSALLLLIFAVVEGPELGFGDPLVLGAFAPATVLGVTFAAVERGKDDPCSTSACWPIRRSRPRRSPWPRSSSCWSRCWSTCPRT
ncbi:MFS transporter [Amycolatopsis cihanbeyliensis]|uniref:MFS transporter n=1 Tax=Amycolatopsis cihanbeyliensis TaxID=1128664 RepID=UPI001B86369D|nr:MFS transporter [Amycolatopsis cihanbeyliensis]